MPPVLKVLVTCAALAAGSAPGAEQSLAGCANDPAASGMQSRMQLMRDQMSRIERTPERAEQAKLLDIHAKHMREGLREMRHRDLGSSCRMDVMSSIMEEMVRHQLVTDERDGR